MIKRSDEYVLKMQDKAYFNLVIFYSSTKSQYFAHKIANIISYPATNKKKEKLFGIVDR